jgi:hypothetical protein
LTGERPEGGGPTGASGTLMASVVAAHGEIVWLAWLVEDSQQVQLSYKQGLA